MAISKRLAPAAAALGMTLVAAGCMSGGPGYSGGGGGEPIRRAASGVEGAWQDPNGPISTFSGGVFETVAVDTGEKLSVGSYTLTGANSVQITGTSLARRARGQPDALSVNCLLISTSQLNCTSSTNQQFVLTRRA